MKKFFLAFFFVSCCCGVSLAQTKNRVGFVFGPNHFSLRGNDFIDDAESDYGSFFGFSYEHKFNKKLSLVTGISLERKVLNYNSKFTSQFFNEEGIYTIEDYTVKTVNKYQYFSVPLLLRYSFAKNNSFFVTAGFFIATTGNNKKTTRITNLTEGESFNIPTSEEYNFPLAGEINGLDYGISFGLGKFFTINKKTNFSIELRDNLGVKNAVANANSFGEYYLIKTNTINLIAQISFDL